MNFQSTYRIPGTTQDFTFQFRQEFSESHWHIWVKYDSERVSHAPHRFFDLGLKICADTVEEVQTKAAELANAIWAVVDTETKTASSPLRISYAS